MCVVDKFGVDRYLYNGECVDACPQAHFHTALKACEPCPSHCKLCSSATHCIKCEDSFFLNDGLCNKLECGEGMAYCTILLEHKKKYWALCPSCSFWFVLFIFRIFLLLLLEHKKAIFSTMSKLPFFYTMEIKWSFWGEIFL